MAVSLKSDLILLGDDIAMRQGAADPSAGGGVAGNLGDFYWQTSTFTIWQKVGTPNTAWVHLTPQDLFGTGSDGDLLVNGGTTTLAQDSFYNDVHITSTGILAPAGFRMYVRGTLLIDAGGVFAANGGNGAAGGAAGSAGATQATWTQGSNAGGLGQAAAGANGASFTQGFNANGSGGAGGAGSGGAGGAAGTITQQAAATRGRPRSLTFGAIGDMVTAGSTLRLSPGGSGGGGGGDGTAGGGGGGGGGGILVYAREIVNNGTMSCNGGNGGSPAAGTRGAGGGGGGGVIILGFHHFEGNTPTVTHGSGGVGTNGAPSNGANGSDGTYVPIQI